MTIRLLLILTLLAPQLALPALASAPRNARCAATTCCEIAVTTTCCGDIVLEMRCGETGDVCRCAVAPGETEPIPQAPRPAERHELGALALSATSELLRQPAPSRTPMLRTTPAPRRTHGETRALLCVWRT